MIEVLSRFALANLALWLSVLLSLVAVVAWLVSDAMAAEGTTRGQAAVLAGMVKERKSREAQPVVRHLVPVDDMGISRLRKSFGWDAPRGRA